MVAFNTGLLEAVATAETGGESNPFIRTRIKPKGGSTAYGPVQITGTLAKDFLNTKKDLFTKEEKGYLKRFLIQADKFNKFGNEPDKKGFEPRFDYGGEGELTSPEDQELYKDVANKMLSYTHTKNNGVLDKTLKEWRFGASSKKGRANDEVYFKKIEDAFQGVQEGQVMTAPLVDIEGEVKESIQQQLEAENASPVASEGLSEGVTAPVQETLTEEEAAMLTVIEGGAQEAETLSPEEEEMLKILEGRESL